MSSSPGHGSKMATEGTGQLSPTSSTRRPLKRENSGKNMNGPLYRQASSHVAIVRRIKRKGEGPMKQFARWFVDNQTGLSFNLFSLLFLAHSFFPKLRVHTTKFFTLAYHNPQTDEYGIGKDDAYLLFFFVTLFTGLRASTMEYILAPFAKKRGLSKRKDITRFSEQAWLLVYVSIFWSLGVYIYANSPYYLSLKELWTSWPNRDVGGLMKAYVLAQLAFWLQQIIVINIEERRKDHWQMFSHHVITISLIFSCYRYGHTRVGNLILVLMDVVDLFLPLAKCLKYLGYKMLCDIMFGVFMLSWFLARHVLYCMVCYSIWAHTPAIIGDGCYYGASGNMTGPFPPPSQNGLSYLLEPFTDSEGIVCFTSTVKWAFLSALGFLQVLTVVWFFMIVQVAIRVLKGDGADDSRSDDEAGESSEEEYEEEVMELEDGDGETLLGDGTGSEGDELQLAAAAAIEEEVGVEALDLKGWERRSGVKRQQSAASGVSLPGHSDRKELLNRIGCEKQID